MSAPARRRILHVFATFGRGGPQVRTTQLMAAMGPGWQHDVLSMSGDHGAAALVPEGLALQLLPTPARRGFAASVRSFAALLREHDPDLLLTYNWGAIEAVAAARWLGWSWHVHHEEGFGPEEQRRRHLRRSLLRRAVLGRTAAVIVPSQNLLRIAGDEWRLPQGRLRYLPNGVDTGRFRPAAAPEGVTSEPAAPRPLTIGTVGGLRAEKDQAMLLRAVAAMQAPARVALVGDGPELPALQALAQQLGIGARTEFRGSVVDPAACYREFDVFALSSRTEQMPLSLLEAMASGLPVAGTDVGDVRVMLPTASARGLVAAGDVGGLARALDALAADPVRRRREGAGNRAHCARHYELATCLERYIEVYAGAARSPAQGVADARLRPD